MRFAPPISSPVIRSSCSIQQLQMEIVLGPEMARHNTHIYGIKQLTRNIEFIMPDLRVELARLMKERLAPKTAGPTSEELPLLGSEWVEVKPLDTLLAIVHRLNQRMFVGLPLCESPSVHHHPGRVSPCTGRNEKWIKAAKGLVFDLSIRGLLLWACPSFFRRCARYPDLLAPLFNYDREGLSKPSWIYFLVQFVLARRCSDRKSKRGRPFQLTNGQFVINLQGISSIVLT